MDMTIGQYYPTNSIIHRLDPRLKLIAVFLYIISVFITNNILVYGVCSLFLVFVVFLSKVPFFTLIKNLRGFIYIFIITTIINIFCNVKGQVFFQFYFLKITSGGLIYSFKILIRLIILILSSSIVTLTTNSIEITDSLESLFKPLKKLKFPVHEASLMLSIALRFIPTILDELNKIKKAQMSRGVDFEGGNFISRVKAFIPLLIPMFLSIFKRADELAMAMESRCYRGDINRTRMKVFKLKNIDFIAIFVFFLYFLLIIFLKIIL